jgi:sigma54-dependent transcription regulator
MYLGDGASNKCGDNLGLQIMSVHTNSHGGNYEWRPTEEFAAAVVAVVSRNASFADFARLTRAANQLPIDGLHDSWFQARRAALDAAAVAEKAMLEALEKYHLAHLTARACENPPQRRYSWQDRIDI